MTTEFDETADANGPAKKMEQSNSGQLSGEVGRNPRTRTVSFDEDSFLNISPFYQYGVVARCHTGPEVGWTACVCCRAAP